MNTQKTPQNELKDTKVSLKLEACCTVGEVLSNCKPNANRKIYIILTSDI